MDENYPSFEGGKKVYLLRGDTVNSLIEKLFTHRPRGTHEGGMFVEAEPDGSFLSAVSGAGDDTADAPEEILPEFEKGKLYLLKQNTVKALEALIKKHHCVAKLDGGITADEQGEEGTWLSTA